MKSGWPQLFRRAISTRSHPLGQIQHSNPALTDTFGRRHNYLRISLTERCNLRCSYCMPAAGIELSPASHILTTPEVLRLASLFVHAGVTKIRLTGGEPTVRKDLLEIVRGLNDLKRNGLETLAMTSNGVVLRRKLEDLINNGLTHLNLSLDTLDPFKFQLLTRRPHTMHAAVLSTLDTALNHSMSSTSNLFSSLSQVKLNVVLIRGLNDDELFSFVELTRSSPLCVRFIEFMPFQGNEWDKRKMVPSHELTRRLKEQHPGFGPVVDEEGDGTSKTWRVPGYKGTVGFISSMSDHFCATCTRLRITADGQVKVCLFDPHEVSLRDMLREGASDEQLLQVIHKAVLGKKAKHAGMDTLARLSEGEGGLKNRAMIKIGLMDRVTPRRARAHEHPSTYIHAMAGCTQARYTSTTASHKNKLTHLDRTGSPRMVDVSSKDVTKRSATAVGKIYINKIAYSFITGIDSNRPESANMAPSYEEAKAELSPELNKEDVDDSRISAVNKARRKAGGDGRNVLTIAQLAGIMGAKSTSTLIPLCHPLQLSHINVSLGIISEGSPEKGEMKYAIRCEATVTCEGKTGVEMEALTSVSVSLLTVWDMLKAVAGQDMLITGVKLVQKLGGKSDFTKDE